MGPNELLSCVTRGSTYRACGSRWVSRIRRGSLGSVAPRLLATRRARVPTPTPRLRCGIVHAHALWVAQSLVRRRRTSRFRDRATKLCGPTCRLLREENRPRRCDPKRKYGGKWLAGYLCINLITYTSLPAQI